MSGFGPSPRLMALAIGELARCNARLVAAIDAETLHDRIEALIAARDGTARIIAELRSMLPIDCTDLVRDDIEVALSLMGMALPLLDRAGERDAGCLLQNAVDVVLGSDIPSPPEQ